MRLRSLLLLLLTVTLLVAGCRREKAQLRGSGAVVSESRPVTAFTRVTLAMPGLVVIEQGDTDAVTVEGDDNILANANTTVVDGNLVIAARNSYLTPHPTAPVTVRVTGKAINTVDVTGVGEGRVRGLTAPELKLILGGPGTLSADDIQVDQLKVSAGGTGRLAVAGRATRQEVTIGGAITYQADSLDSRDAAITASDSARAIVRASDSLNATVANGATIEYLGSPRVTERVIGSGQVRPYAP